jgi:hypothetical protein
MNIVDTLIEVKLNEQDDFLKIRETLSRIGIAAKKERRLYQSCHILHKQGKYYIVHFKELFALDGKPTNFSDEDKGRRNTIIALLEEWGLVKVVNSATIETPRATLNNIKILPYGQKDEWELCAKYNIGRK